MLRTTLSPHRRSRLQLDLFGREGLIRLLVNLQVIFFKIRYFLNSLITEPVPPARPRRRFRSSRLIGEFEKPWLEDNKRRPNWDSIIFYTCIGIALGKQLTKLYPAGMILTLLAKLFRVISVGLRMQRFPSTRYALCIAIITFWICKLSDLHPKVVHGSR